MTDTASFFSGINLAVDVGKPALFDNSVVNHYLQYRMTSVATFYVVSGYAINYKHVVVTSPTGILLSMAVGTHNDIVITYLDFSATNFERLFFFFIIIISFFRP